MALPAELGAAVDKQNKNSQKLELVTGNLREAVYGLAMNLSQSEPILQFRKTSDLLEDDKEALRLMEEATELQQKLYAEQYTGNYTEEDVIALRVLRNQIAMNKIIQEQAEARQMAVEFLREINMEISNLLGFDFGSLTRRPGSGC